MVTAGPWHGHGPVELEGPGGPGWPGRQRQGNLNPWAAAVGRGSSVPRGQGNQILANNLVPGGDGGQLRTFTTLQWEMCRGEIN